MTRALAYGVLLLGVVSPLAHAESAITSAPEPPQLTADQMDTVTAGETGSFGTVVSTSGPTTFASTVSITRDGTVSGYVYIMYGDAAAQAYKLVGRPEGAVILEPVSSDAVPLAPLLTPSDAALSVLTP